MLFRKPGDRKQTRQVGPNLSKSLAAPADESVLPSVQILRALRSEPKPDGASTIEAYRRFVCKLDVSVLLAYGQHYSRTPS